MNRVGSVSLEKLGCISYFRPVSYVLCGYLVSGGYAYARAVEMTRESIEERIEPVSEVAVQTDDVSSTPAKAGDNRGQEVYDKFCFTCHDPNPKIPLGAPIKGDLNAWKARIEKGMKELVDKAMAGFNAMPAKGTCGDCSAEDLEKAIAVMLPKEKS